MSEPSGPRAWLTVVAAAVFVAALAVWSFSAGTVEQVFGFTTVAAGVVLVVVSVVSAVVEHQPGCVLVGVALAGVGALLTAVVFGFAYLEESWTYVRGEQTTAQVATCEDDGDDCESTWTVGGREHRGEVELALDAPRGGEIPVRAHDDDAVRAGGLTVLVVASSGVALLTPVLVLGAVLWGRRRGRGQATERHQPSGGSGSDTSSS